MTAKCGYQRCVYGGAKGWRGSWSASKFSQLSLDLCRHKAVPPN